MSADATPSRRGRTAPSRQVDAGRANGLRRARLAQAAVIGLLCVVVLAFLPLHDAPWWPATPDARRAWSAVLVAAAWFALVGATLWRTRRRQAGGATAGGTVGPAPDGPDAWLVVHASQTGQAAEYARQTANALRAANLPVRECDIATLDVATLAATRQALFVASTTGEGDAPDPAARFLDHAMRQADALSHLRYAVLALGDRTYRNYCAFGHTLDEWLRRSGATPLFDLVEVDNGDPAALRHWQHHLGVVSGTPELPDWSPAAYARWALAARRELNPGSVGAPVYEVRLAPPSVTGSAWRAGDVVEVGPRQAPDAVEAWLTATGLEPDAMVDLPAARMTFRAALARAHLPDPERIHGQDAAAVAAGLQPLPSREYSVASIPDEGPLRIVLRRMLRPDGTPGIGSGWLCDHAPVGGAIDVRIRANAGFHGPDPDVPLILVGNGTGIAGLRAHLAERIASGSRRHWLLFGERHADRDFHLGEDILRWLERGELERLDLAFSRDTAGSGVPPGALADGRAAVHAGYVQDALRAEAARLQRWVDGGATVLVCGSLAGMAPGVDAVLRGTLGDARVDALRADGRYRRDVY